MENRDLNFSQYLELQSDLSLLRKFWDKNSGQIDQLSEIRSELCLGLASIRVLSKHYVLLSKMSIYMDKIFVENFYCPNSPRVRAIHVYPRLYFGRTSSKSGSDGGFFLGQDCSIQYGNEHFFGILDQEWLDWIAWSHAVVRVLGNCWNQRTYAGR